MRRIFLFIMKKNNKCLKIIYVKNSKTNWTPATSQTRRIREKTNTKINQLGKKYYSLKALFDRLGLQRDALFLLGKQLENDYKNQKPGIILQNQCRRMKDAIYCWYTEYFFTEIFEPNSDVLKRLIATKMKGNEHISKSNKNTSLKDFHNLKKDSSQSENKNESYSIYAHDDVFQDIKVNQEMDSFEISSNLSEHNHMQKEEISNVNFDFEKLFQF